MVGENPNNTVDKDSRARRLKCYENNNYLEYMAPRSLLKVYLETATLKTAINHSYLFNRVIIDTTADCHHHLYL